MATSIREQIIADIISALESMTEETNEVEFKKVLRIPGSSLTAFDFPLMQVQDINEEKTDQPVGFTSCQLLLSLVAIQQNWDDLSQEANKIIAAVEKKLKEDINRSNLAIDTNIVGNELFVSDEISNPIGGVIISVVVLYRHLLGNPFSQ